MRRISLLVAAAAVRLAAGLAAPPRAQACSGCTRDRLIHDSSHIVLVRYTGRSGRFAVFDVVAVHKGPCASGAIQAAKQSQAATGA